MLKYHEEKGFAFGNITMEVFFKKYFYPGII
jgi:hypothetical protein